MNLLANLLNTLPSVIGAAAVAPSLLILWTVASMDNRREPARVVLIAFLLGAVGAFLISYVRLPDAGALLGWPVLQSYVVATVNVASPEEALKLIVLVFFCSRYIAHDHPMEGVVYGAAVGLGFAAFENLAYLGSNPEVWKSLALIRGLFTVPVHGALGVIIGIFAVEARFGSLRGDKPVRRLRITSYLAGWGIATVLHGLFDFPLLLQRQLAPGESSAAVWWLGAGLAAAGIVTLVAARIIYSARRLQAAEHNSFTHRRRFHNHPWHVTGLVMIVMFIAALPLLGWARDMMG